MKVPNIEIHDNPSSGSRADTRGETRDAAAVEHDEANRRFSEYAHAPNINVMMIINSL
jgi:hypothetical protein